LTSDGGMSAHAVKAFIADIAKRDLKAVAARIKAGESAKAR
jgi:hypothetical protein